MGDYYARFRGGRRVKLPPATRPDEFFAGRRRGAVATDEVGEAMGMAVLLGQRGSPGSRLARL